MPSPYDEDDPREFVASSLRDLESGAGAHLLVVDGDGRLLGACGIGVHAGDRRGEIGYWVVAAERGRGVATTAARRLCRFGFDVLGLGYIGLHAATGNAASNAVARRLGFALEGTSRSYSIQGHGGEGPRIDMHVYGLRPGELR